MLKHRLRSRFIAMALAPVLAVGIAGCSSGGTSRTSASSGSSPSATMTGATTDAEAFFGPVIAAAKAKGTVHMTATVSMANGSTSATSKGVVRYTDSSTEMALTTNLKSSGLGVMEIRMVGGVIYASIPPLTPKGKFFKLDPSDPNLSSLLGSVQGASIGQSMTTLQKSLVSIDDQGADTIDGQTYEKYQIVVDAKKAIEGFGQNPSAIPSLPATFTYELWVGSDHLLRRMEISEMGTSTRTDFTQWGAPVSIKAPKASDIVKAPSGL